MGTAWIVVPCFNEAARLEPQRFARFAAGHPEIDFLFVDDGSTDDTGALLKSLAGTTGGRFRVLQLSRNGGKAEAVRRGVLAALEAEPAYVGYWDADLATPLEEIPRFLRILAEREEVDVLLGSRVKLLGRSVERSSVRHLAGRVFATVASWVLGLAVYDTQCGAKLLRVGPEVREAFADPFLADWAFDVEVLARLVSGRRARGLEDPAGSLREEPVREWRDVRGSKVKPWHFVVAIAELQRIRWRYPAARGMEHGALGSRGGASTLPGSPSVPGPGSG